MKQPSPREAALHAPVGPVSSEPGVDRVAGCGVMGVPFTTGDYLALRRWPATSFGPGYTSVWHRDPAGSWTIHADAPPERSCVRFMGAAVEHTRTVPIRLEWPADDRLVVTVGTDIEWTLRLGETVTSRMLTGTAGALPSLVWRTGPTLWLIGSSAGAMLRTGRLQLAGRAPNGHLFRVTPLRTWTVPDTSARVLGRDLGAPHPLPRPPRIGKIRLPQRGIFFADTSATFAEPPGTSRSSRPGDGDVDSTARHTNTHRGEAA